MGIGFICHLGQGVAHLGAGSARLGCSKTVILPDFQVG